MSGVTYNPPPPKASSASELPFSSIGQNWVTRLPLVQEKPGNGASAKEKIGLIAFAKS